MKVQNVASVQRVTSDWDGGRKKRDEGRGQKESELLSKY